MFLFDVCLFAREKQGRVVILGPKGSSSLPEFTLFQHVCLAVKGPGTDLTCHDDNWHIKVVAGVPEDSSKSQIHAKSTDMGSIPVLKKVIDVVEHRCYSRTNSDINQNCPRPKV